MKIIGTTTVKEVETQQLNFGGSRTNPESPVRGTEIIFAGVGTSGVNVPPNKNLHALNAEVRRRTGCPPLSETIRSRRLCLLGHIARAEPEMDHCQALRAAIKSLHEIGKGDEDARLTPGPVLLRLI